MVSIPSGGKTKLLMFLTLWLVKRSNSGEPPWKYGFRLGSMVSIPSGGKTKQFEGGSRPKSNQFQIFCRRWGGGGALEVTSIEQNASYRNKEGSISVNKYRTDFNLPCWGNGAGGGGRALEVTRIEQNSSNRNKEGSIRVNKHRTDFVLPCWGEEGLKV